jgi:ATP-dependent protease ClpP protease subunit
MTSYEAKEYGIIDEVLENRKWVWKRREFIQFYH